MFFSLFLFFFFFLPKYAISNNILFIIHVFFYCCCPPSAQVLVTQLQFDGQMIPAHKWGVQQVVEKLELSADEEQMQEKARKIWSSILSGQNIEDSTDFFKCGAGSMDVTRWVWFITLYNYFSNVFC